MKEVEVKARITNIEKLKLMLSGVGSQFGNPLIEDDVIFLPAGVEFSKIRKGTPVIRIRSSEDIVTLTMKKRVIAGKELIKLEKEVVVNDKKQAIEIVEHMNFHEVLRVVKKRIKAKYERMTVCIDDVVGLGCFIEIEEMSETNDAVATQNRLVKFMESLGIGDDDIIKKGYDTLIYEKNKQ